MRSSVRPLSQGCLSKGLFSTAITSSAFEIRLGRSALLVRGRIARRTSQGVMIGAESVSKGSNRFGTLEVIRGIPFRQYFVLLTCGNSTAL